MAAYPSYPQLVGSVRGASSGTVVDRAVSGKPRFRSFYSQPWFVFSIVHEVYAAEKDAIEAHYLAHQFQSFAFTFSGDGATYVCRWAEYPQLTAIEGDQRWRVQSALVGVERVPYGIVFLTEAATVSVTGSKA